MSRNSSRVAFIAFMVLMGMALLLFLGSRYFNFEPSISKQTVLVVVGDRKITWGNLQSYLLEKYKSPARIDTLSSQDIEKSLLELIDQNLLIAEAYRKGAQRIPHIIRKVKLYRQILLNEKLVEKCVIDSILTRERLKKFYENYGGEIRLREIYFSAPSPSLIKKMSPADKMAQEKARKLAYSVYERLRHGESFSQLARQYSEDARTAPHGGDLGFVRWGQLQKEVQEVAFKLKMGELSEPIRSSFGYHIIQLTARKKRPFAEELPTLKAQLSAIYRQLIQNRKEQLYFQLEKKYGASFHQDNISYLAQKVGPHYAPFSKLTEKDRRRILAYFNHGEISVADFLEAVDKQIHNYLWNVPNIRKWVRVLLRRAIGAYEAERLQINVSKSVQHFQEQLMRAWLKEQELQEELVVTEQEMRRYYETHLREFTPSERLRVGLILLQDIYLAEKVAKKARQGESFTELARYYSTHSYSKKRGGDLGYIVQHQYPEVFKLAQNLKIGEIAGPTYITEGIAIIKLLDRQTSQPFAFDEVKNKIYHQLIEEKKQNRYHRFIEDLKVKYPVKIERKNLSRVLEEDVV